MNNLLFFFNMILVHMFCQFSLETSQNHPSNLGHYLSLSLYISYSLALSGRGSRDRFALGCFLPTLEGTAMDAGTTDGQAAEVEWQS